MAVMSTESQDEDDNADEGDQICEAARGRKILRYLGKYW